MTGRNYAAGLMLVIAASGCGGKSSQYEVEGTVTYNGSPLPEGDIMFIPEDKQFGAEGGQIKDGKFKLRARGGPNRVEIRATREIPGEKGPMGEPALEDYIPSDFNDNSTLKADVGPGKTKFEFPLKGL